MLAGQLEELQRRLLESHAQAQTMQEVMEERLRERTQAAAQAEHDLRAELSDAERYSELDCPDLITCVFSIEGNLG